LFENTKDSRIFAYAVAFLAVASGAKGWREVKSIVGYNVADRLGRMGEGMTIVHELGTLPEEHMEDDGKNERSPAYFAHPDRPIQILGKPLLTVTQPYVAAFHEERKKREEREELDKFRRWKQREESERRNEETRRNYVGLYEDDRDRDRDEHAVDGGVEKSEGEGAETSEGDESSEGVEESEGDESSEQPARHFVGGEGESEGHPIVLDDD